MSRQVREKLASLFDLGVELTLLLIAKDDSTLPPRGHNLVAERTKVFEDRGYARRADPGEFARGLVLVRTRHN